MDPRKNPAEPGSLSGTIHETKSVPYTFSFTTHEDASMMQNIDRSIHEINSCKIEQVEHRPDQDLKTNALPAHTSKGSHFHNTSHITHCWSILLKAMRLQAIPCVGIGTRQFVRVDLPNTANPCETSGFIKPEVSQRPSTSYVLCSLWERFLPGV